MGTSENETFLRDNVVTIIAQIKNLDETLKDHITQNDRLHEETRRRQEDFSGRLIALENNVHVLVTDTIRDMKTNIKNHETRIREGEKWKWKTAGAIATLSAGISIILSIILNFI